MRTMAFGAALLLMITPCYAQRIALWETRRDLNAAIEELDKVVTFCEYCKATGTVDGKPCARCAGRGTILKSEEKIIKHRKHLELKAERLGIPKDKYAQLDVGKRLPTFQKEIESEALAMLAAYVQYMKAYREHKDVIVQDDRLRKLTEKVTDGLDALIDTHGPNLRIASLRMLYADDPVGKVGAFNLYGEKRAVRIDGQDVECLKLRTVKDYVVLIMKAGAKKRKGFVVAEVIGKQTYKTDDAEQIQGILMQAY